MSSIMNIEYKVNLIDMYLKSNPSVMLKWWLRTEKLKAVKTAVKT